MKLSCFKAYDIRGQLGVNLDGDIARRIGRGFARTLTARKVVLGRDIRASSTELAQFVTDGLLAEGCDILELGLSGTEEMYHAVSHFRADGGICVTASHNPMDYNGMKMVRAGSAPLDSATELATIRELAERDDFGPALTMGKVHHIEAQARAAYTHKVQSFVDCTALTPQRVVVNSGNGAAGPTLDAIIEALHNQGAPLDVIRLHHDPDGTFPNGIPNPLLPENRSVTSECIRANNADLGVAWDGDFDRCFFFDGDGAFVDGEYVVGLLAQVFLDKEPGATIIHDPRVIWNTRDIVTRSGGHATQARTGHAFIKQAMRDHGAVYGGEMSAHHYFRDFFHCDSGMIPFVMMLELISRKGPLAALAAERRRAFPSSGERNFRLPDPGAALAAIRAEFTPKARAIDETDGLGVNMGDWRFNLRCSNTEPLVRLNVETTGRPVAELVTTLSDRLRAS